jgi:hypothetical protein
MMDRLSNPKNSRFNIAAELKDIMRPLFQNIWMISYLVTSRKR